MGKRSIRWTAILGKTVWIALFVMVGIIIGPNTLLRLGWPITLTNIFIIGLCTGVFAELAIRLPTVLIEANEDKLRIYARKHPSFRRRISVGSINLVSLILGGTLVISLVRGFYTIFFVTLILISLLLIAFFMLLSLFPKLLIGVEGNNDINFLKTMASTLRKYGEEVPDLEKLEENGDIVFLPMGGSGLTLWTSRLEVLNRPEFYIIDRDTQPPAPPKYETFLNEVNQRRHCEAVVTSKREMENYLHPVAIKAVYPNVNVTFSDFDDVPLLVAQAIHATSQSPKLWVDLPPAKQDEKVKNAKRWLNTLAVEHMTPALLAQSDPNSEIQSWLRRISELLKD